MSGGDGDGGGKAAGCGGVVSSDGDGAEGDNGGDDAVSGDDSEGRAASGMLVRQALRVTASREALRFRARCKASCKLRA